MNNEDVLLLPYALFFAGDNPMQAELASQLGLQGNFFCRTCYVGGTKEFKSSLEGYATLFKVCNFLFRLKLKFFIHLSLGMSTSHTHRNCRRDTETGRRVYTVWSTG